jgi:hypothetical protein
VVDDVKSNWGEDDELELREAVLKFRGSKKEDSEGLELMVVGWFIVGSRVVLLS